MPVDPKRERGPKDSGNSPTNNLPPVSSIRNMRPHTAPGDQSGPFTPPESPRSTPDPPSTQLATETQQPIPRVSVAALRGVSHIAPRATGSPALGSSGNLPDSFRLSPRGAFYQPRTLTGAPLLDLKRDGSGSASPAPRKARATAEPPTPLPAGPQGQRREGIPRASSDGKVRSRRRRSASLGTPSSAGRADLVPGPVQPGEVFLPPPFIALRAIERYGEARVTFKIERSSMGPTYGARGAFGVSDPESPAIKVSYKEPLAEESAGPGGDAVTDSAALRGAAGGSAPLLPIADVAESEEGDGHLKVTAGSEGGAPGPTPGPATPGPDSASAAPRAARSDSSRPAARRSLSDWMTWIGSLSVSQVYRMPRRPSSPGSPAS